MPYLMNGEPIPHGAEVIIDGIGYSMETLTIMGEDGRAGLGLTWVEPEPIVPSVEQLCAAVDKERDRRLALDFDYDFEIITAVDDGGAEIEAGVRSLQMRPEDRSNWQTALGVAHTAVISGAPNSIVALRAEDNWNIQTSALQVMATMAAMASHGAALLFAGGAIKSAIRGAEDPASIDITTGWPP